MQTPPHKLGKVDKCKPICEPTLAIENMVFPVLAVDYPTIRHACYDCEECAKVLEMPKLA
jgi:hypothetical protein